VEKILKRIEHRLKAQDSLAKQEIMHGKDGEDSEDRVVGSVSDCYSAFLCIFGCRSLLE
jgi:enoyl reductase-like protein